MEQLQDLLIEYNRLNLSDIEMTPWSMQYCGSEFPEYWKIVFCIVSTIPRKKRVVEVGCGLGDVTSIFCYLGYQHITALEKVPQIAKIANRRISDMFKRNNVVRCETYPNSKSYKADILVLVNCVYKDMATSREEYLKTIRLYYENAGCPQYFILEVIDTSYTKNDEEFPYYLRLDRNDIAEIFPGFEMSEWQTYRYPKNKKSKTLYLIEKQ